MPQFLIGLGLGVLLAAVLAAVAWRRHQHRLLLLERRAQAAERLAELGTMTAGLVKQAVLNLLINAVQAMTDARQAKPPIAHGGCSELIIRTETRKKLGHNEVVIHVIDTGPGIEADKIAKIWQPYFSSKKNGTGLGLPTTRRIVQEHGGSIDVHSELGQGTDFAINLPIDREKLPSQA